MLTIESRLAIYDMIRRRRLVKITLEENTVAANKRILVSSVCKISILISCLMALVNSFAIR
jgi:hypothetical protein